MVGVTQGSYTCKACESHFSGARTACLSCGEAGTVVEDTRCDMCGCALHGGNRCGACMWASIVDARPAAQAAVRAGASSKNTINKGRENKDMTSKKSRKNNSNTAVVEPVAIAAEAEVSLTPMLDAVLARGEELLSSAYGDGPATGDFVEVPGQFDSDVRCPKCATVVGCRLMADGRTACFNCGYDSRYNPGKASKAARVATARVAKVKDTVVVRAGTGGRDFGSHCNIPGCSNVLPKTYLGWGLCPSCERKRNVRLYGAPIVREMVGEALERYNEYKKIVQAGEWIWAADN